MTTTTNVKQTKLNIMTQSQYNSATKNATELYMVTDAQISYNDLTDKPTIPDTSNLANKDLSNLSATGEAKFQVPLVSGTNIKTINNNSILGSGNLTLDGLPSQTGKAGLYLQTDGTDASWQGVPGRNIGEIVSSTIPLTDAGLHLLDGSLLAYGSYKDFIDYIASIYDASANYFCTEADWQTAVTTYGVCGKFVYDSVNNTVRLPKITGIIEGTTDLTALGDLVEAGLPNVTGELSPSKSNNDNTSTRWTLGYGSGAFSINSGTVKREPSVVPANKTDVIGATFDASRSSSIYGNSNTVQPQTIKAFYYIVIATSAKTDIQVDIDEIATDLNGKADTDLSNVPNSKGILTESYVNGTSWYRVYSDGWCEQGGEIATSAYEWLYITFLKAFINANYTITAMSNGNSTGGYFKYPIYDTKTASSIRILNSYAGGGYPGTVSWYACGYIS